MNKNKDQKYKMGDGFSKHGGMYYIRTIYACWNIKGKKETGDGHCTNPGLFCFIPQGGNWVSSQKSHSVFCDNKTW